MDSFETERMRAERLQPEDFNQLYEFHRDPEVMQTLGGVRTADETQQWLTHNLDHWHQHHYGIWILRDRQSHDFIGRGGLRNVVIERCHEVEIAYALRSEYWGKGLATEMTIAVLELARTLKIIEVVAITQTTNTASRKVMEKAGFGYERDLLWKDEPCALYRQRLI